MNNKPIAILNTTIATTDGLYRISTITLDVAKELVSKSPILSAIGHQSTADILTEAAATTSENIRQEAAALAQEPIYVPPVVVVPKAVPKMAGGPVYRTVWNAEVTDLKALCMAVATGKVSINAILPNETFLRQQAVSLKNTMNIPGVRAYEKRV